MLKGHLTMLLTIPSKTINFFQYPALPFKELNFSLTTDPQPLTSFTHDPEWRISVTVWRPQYRTGLVCSGLVLGHHMLYVLSKLLYYIPIVCFLQKVEPLIIISIHCYIIFTQLHSNKFTTIYIETKEMPSKKKKADTQPLAMTMSIVLLQQC